MDESKELIYLLEKMTDKVSLIFDIPKENAFSASTFILSQPQFPGFKNISEEDNESIKSYFDRYKRNNFNNGIIRRAFNEAYLFSLRDYSEVEINTTSELIILYLRMITITLRKLMDFEHVVVLNPYSNIGSLASSLAISNLNDEDLFVVEEREKYASLTMNLRDLLGYKYKVSNSLPSLSFRSDIIVSDPFLRNTEDILIFFEDYHDYLNEGGFFVVSLMSEYVRSRVFADMVERYGLILIGLIEYPKDLYDGIIENTIVILEKKGEKNKEFFRAEMPSVKNIEANYKVLNDIETYLKNYLKGE